MFTFPVFVQHIIHFWGDLRAFTSADIHDVFSCHTAKQARRREVEMRSPLITRNPKQNSCHQHSKSLIWESWHRVIITLSKSRVRSKGKKEHIMALFFLFFWLGFLLVRACVLIILFMRDSQSHHLQTRPTLAFLLILLHQACLSTVSTDPPCETAINKSDRQA